MKRSVICFWQIISHPVFWLCLVRRRQIMSWPSQEKVLTMSESWIDDRSWIFALYCACSLIYYRCPPTRNRNCGIDMVNLTNYVPFTDSWSKKLIDTLLVLKIIMIINSNQKFRFSYWTNFLMRQIDFFLITIDYISYIIFTCYPKTWKINS